MENVGASGISGRWGVNNGSINEDKLKPLGLVCYGGESSETGFTYSVKSFDGKFEVELTYEEFQNVDIIYHDFKLKQRKDKLENIENNHMKKI